MGSTNKSCTRLIKSWEYPLKPTMWDPPTMEKTPITEDASEQKAIQCYHPNLDYANNYVAKVGTIETKELLKLQEPIYIFQFSKKNKRE